MVKFQIYKDKKEEFRFRLIAGNGQTILVSEGYKLKSSCLNGIESVIKNSQDQTKFEMLEAKNGKVYFNLKATNGQIIGSSQMYKTKRSLKNGILSVSRNAPKAVVIE